MATENRQEQFADTPEGWASLWAVEFAAAKKAMEKSHRQGEQVVKRFLDERETALEGDTRLNLYTANVQTKRAMMYGNTPRVDVARKFADANDDIARVAGEMLERLLNCDIERDDDDFAQAHDYALMDYLLPGLGLVRYRLEVEQEDVPETPAILDEQTGMEIAPAVPAGKRTVPGSERVCCDYKHWKDVLWSPSRVWHEVRWVGYLNEMSPSDVEARFGADLAKLIPYNASKRDTVDGEKKTREPWDRAAVWEFESKEHGKRFWWVEGFGRVLDMKDDALGLDGFFSCPRPLLANLTTSAVVPRSDFVLYQDQYKEIDLISTRINLLQRAIRVVGVYDKASPEVKGILTELAQNEMLPSENWGKFLQGGGLKGSVDWFPIDMVVNALMALRDMRRELIDLLHQAEGMADIMRGEATQAGATATEQRIKARYGSVRIQAMQDEFARFATDGQRIKAEIITKHFSPETIIQHSNVMATPDADKAQAAVELLKSKFSNYRVAVKSEALSQTDYQSLQQERMEVLTGIAGFMQAMAPMAQLLPMPVMLQMLQWSVSGLRGSSTIEGVLDQAIAQAQQAAAAPKPQTPPDPKVMAAQMKMQGEQMKAQAEMAKVDKELQADVVRTQLAMQETEAKERAQAEWNVREAAQKQMVMNSLKPPEPPRPGPLVTRKPTLGGPLR